MSLSQKTQPPASLPYKPGKLKSACIKEGQELKWPPTAYWTIRSHIKCLAPIRPGNCTDAKVLTWPGTDPEKVSLTESPTKKF